MVTRKGLRKHRLRIRSLEKSTTIRGYFLKNTKIYLRSQKNGAFEYPLRNVTNQQAGSGSDSKHKLCDFYCPITKNTPNYIFPKIQINSDLVLFAQYVRRRLKPSCFDNFETSKYTKTEAIIEKIMDAR